MFEKKNEEYYMNKGRECKKNEKYNDAIKYYNKAIKLNPKCWRAYNNIGICYKELKEYEKAFKYFNKAIDIAPDSPIPYANRGNLYDLLKKYDEALSDYNKALELDNDNPKCIFEILTNRGDTYRLLGKYDEALKDLNKAVELNKENHCAPYENRGYCYKNMGKYKEAIEDFTKALELAPENIEIYYEEIGQCYTELGDYKKGLFYLNNTTMMNKNSLLAYAYKMHCYQNLGNYNESISDTTKYIEILNNDDNIKATQIYIYAYLNALLVRGFGNCTLGNMEEAIEDFTKAIAIYDSDIEIKNNDIHTYFEFLLARGYAYLDNKDFQKAYEDLIKFKEYDGEDKDLDFKIGICLGMTGRENDAGEYMKSAINTYTDLINKGKGENYDYFQRGQCYMCLEKYEEALADFDKALKLTKKHELLKAISELKDECIKLMNEKS